MITVFQFLKNTLSLFHMFVFMKIKKDEKQSAIIEIRYNDMIESMKISERKSDDARKMVDTDPDLGRV